MRPTNATAAVPRPAVRRYPGRVRRQRGRPSGVHCVHRYRLTVVGHGCAAPGRGRRRRSRISARHFRQAVVRRFGIRLLVRRRRRHGRHRPAGHRYRRPTAEVLVRSARRVRASVRCGGRTRAARCRPRVGPRQAVHVVRHHGAVQRRRATDRRRAVLRLPPVPAPRTRPTLRRRNLSNGRRLRLDSRVSVPAPRRRDQEQ